LVRRERWGRIDRACYRGEELPAVSHYKISETYFALDGNHRVSVAKYHNVAAIDAKVVELTALIKTVEPLHGSRSARRTHGRL
jgi:hypothetical protein